MSKKNYTKLIIAIAALVLFNSSAFAFKPYKSPKDEIIHAPVYKLTPIPKAPTSAPFDGGITLLIAAGVGYASKKGFDKKRKLKEGQNVVK